MNVQPVIPVSIGRDWNLINRVILPVIDSSHVVPGAGSQFGLGDTVASFFVSPNPACPRQGTRRLFPK